MNPRHSWGDPARFEHKTERVCTKCGIVKVTHHEGEERWVEFWKDEVRVSEDRTPPCEGRAAE